MDEKIPDGSTVVPDKVYDADARVREKLKEKKCTAVIPPKANRNNPAYSDEEIYKDRHLIENFFGKLRICRHLS